MEPFSHIIMVLQIGYLLKLSRDGVTEFLNASLSSLEGTKVCVTQTFTREPYLKAQTYQMSGATSIYILNGSARALCQRQVI